MLPVALVAAALAHTPPVQLAHLSHLYLAYDLPLPPKDARLLRDAFTPPPGKIGSPRRRVGFELQPHTETAWGEALFGCEADTVYPEHITEIKPDPKTIAADEVSLPTALQFYHRGWRELALDVYTRGGRWGDRRPGEVLAWAAFGCWERRLLNPAVDRAKVARRLELAFQAEPGAFIDSDHARQFQADLLLSLAVSEAKPGTVEAAIDELIDASREGFRDCTDPLYDAVAARGFDAVPALIAHLGDNRLTRFKPAFVGGFGPGRHSRVKHLVSDLLTGLIHDGEDAYELTEDGAVRAEDAKAWWDAVKDASEEEYAVARVLMAKGGWPNRHLLLVIERKYPHRLPEVFRTVLTDRPKVDLRDVAAAVAGSSLPKETKRALLLEAVGSKNRDWQRAGREHLRVVDADEFHQQLLAVLKTLSGKPTALPTEDSDVKKAYYRSSPEAEFASEVSYATDPAVWTAAEKYLRAADAGLRAEWLGEIHWDNAPAATRPHRLKLLAAFLTDAAVRDVTATPDLYPGSYAGYPDFPKVEVRNLAAMQLGRMLGLKAKPKPTWTAAEWQVFRDEVTKAAK